MTVLSFDVDPNPESQNIHYLSMEDGYKAVYNEGPVKNDIPERSLEGPFASIVSFYKLSRLGCEGIQNNSQLR